MKRLLLVEDSPTQAKLVTLAVSDYARVTVAPSLWAALMHLGQDQFDAVILDLHLPDSQGEETFNAVREKNPTVPVVVHSGTEDDGLLRKLVQNGAACCLRKGRDSTTRFCSQIAGAISAAERYSTETAFLRMANDLVNELRNEPPET